MTQHQPRARYRINQVIEKYVQFRGPNRFRVQIREGGVKVNKTFETLEDAREFKKRTVAQLLGRTYVDASLAEKTTLACACDWGLEINPSTGLPNAFRTEANWKNLKSHFAWWRDKSPFRHWTLAGPAQGNGVRGIHDFDLKRWTTAMLAFDIGDDVEDSEEAELEILRLEQEDATIRAIKPQTIVHRLNALSVLYQDWRFAHSLTEAQCPNPVVRGVRLGLQGTRREARRLHDEEFDLLLATATASSRPWLADAIAIAVETGMRQTELATLGWERVFLDRKYPHAHLTKTKNGEQRRVPLSRAAIAAFRRLHQMANHHNAKRQARIEEASTEKQRAVAMAAPVWSKPLPVATGRGIIHAFRDAIADAQRRAKEAGDPNWSSVHDNLRWHDLRHEAVSRMFEDGDLLEFEVMEIVGHLSKEMLRHYLKLRTERLGEKLPGNRPDGNGGDKLGTVKIRWNEEAVVLDVDGQWIRLSAADEILRGYVRKSLLAALDELGEVATS